MNEEVLLPFPDEPSRIPAAQNFRSTWVLSSLQTLKERGHYDRYIELLPAEHRDTVPYMVAGQWIPMTLAQIHYTACRSLDLPEEEQLQMGRGVGRRAQGTLLATAVAMAKSSGVTPWTVLPQYDRLYRRGADGGATAVFKLGPKEARIEIVGCELLANDYFRTAFRGVLLDVASLFCNRAYVHDQTRRHRLRAAAFLFQWA